MLLRIHPPNQGYLKAHSLYSNHVFRLVCSIAITTQKRIILFIECTLPLHVIYLFSLQTIHSFAVSSWRDYVRLWCATFDNFMAQSYSTYPRSKHNKERGGSRRLLMKPLKGQGARYPFKRFRPFSMLSVTSKSSYFIRSFFQVIKVFIRSVLSHSHDSSWFVFMRAIQIIILYSIIFKSLSLAFRLSSQSPGPNLLVLIYS